MISKPVDFSFGLNVLPLIKASPDLIAVVIFDREKSGNKKATPRGGLFRFNLLLED